MESRNMDRKIDIGELPPNDARNAAVHGPGPAIS